MGSHGPTGGGLLRQTSQPLYRGPGMPEGCRLVEWRSCMSVDCQLGRLYGHGPGGDCAGLRRHEGRSSRDCECLWLTAWQALGAWLGGERSCRTMQTCEVRPSRTEIGCVCISSMEGLRGAGLQSGYCAGLCRPWGAQPSGMEIMHVWISGMAGHGNVAQESGDPAGLCKPEGCGPMEWILVQACADMQGVAQQNRDCVWGSPVLQTVGTWPGRS
jgi:hypothetical protein